MATLHMSWFDRFKISGKGDHTCYIHPLNDDLIRIAPRMEYPYSYSTHNAPIGSIHARIGTKNVFRMISDTWIEDAETVNQLIKDYKMPPMKPIDVEALYKEFCEVLYEPCVIPDILTTKK